MNYISIEIHKALSHSLSINQLISNKIQEQIYLRLKTKLTTLLNYKKYDF